MDVQTFLELFIKELEINPDLRPYYRLLERNGRFYWRRAYLEQRLEYVMSHLGIASGRIWDAGCGFATTSIFLALNGYEVMGNTIEFYYDYIGRRLDYWSRFGNLGNLRIEHADLFDRPFGAQQFDAVVAQDVLHHLEPVHEAIGVLRDSLIPGGRLVVIEENGNSVFIALKNFIIRGFNRETASYDERLQKRIVMGNENPRSLRAWKEILNHNGLTIVDQENEYLRILPPCFFTQKNYLRMAQNERNAGKRIPLLREISFFGINFTAINPIQH
jgi:SAM-dependent methyltransferase